MTMRNIPRLIREAERLLERMERAGRSRAERIAELRRVIQTEHPDKGGDRLKFERAMMQLDKLRSQKSA
jgi:hypothetical protein